MTDLDIFRQHYNAMAELLGLPQCVVLTDKRKAALRARIKEHGEDNVCRAIEALKQSEFLAGANDRGWRANFDFVMRPGSFVKLLEGAYTSATVKKMSNVERLRHAERSSRLGMGADRQLPEHGEHGGSDDTYLTLTVDNALDGD